MITKPLAFMIVAILSFSCTVQAKQEATAVDSSTPQTKAVATAKGAEKKVYAPPTTQDIITAVGETARYAIDMNVLLLTGLSALVGIIISGVWLFLIRPIAKYKKSIKKYKKEIKDELKGFRSYRDNITNNMSSQSQLQVAILFYQFLNLSVNKIIKVDKPDEFKEMNIHLAREYIDKAWQLKPTESWIKSLLYSMSGTVNGVDNKLEDACRDFKKGLAIAGDPDDLEYPFFHYNLACALAQLTLTGKAKEKEAIEHLNKIIGRKKYTDQGKIDDVLNPIRNHPDFPKEFS